MSDDNESFRPHWVILDPEIDRTRPAIPELDGEGVGPLVPNVVEQKLLLGYLHPGTMQPITEEQRESVRNHRIFYVHPETWAALPDWHKAQFEPYEVQEEKLGESIDFLT